MKQLLNQFTRILTNRGGWVLMAGILTQIWLGSVYAWSVIDNALVGEFGFMKWQTQLIYGIQIGVFAFGTIITGPLVYKLGPKIMTGISAGLFALSYSLASLSGGDFILITITLGFLMGMAIASGYVVPLATATTWFPNIKGTVTGLAVMGFGGGAIISGFLFTALLGSDLKILETFLPFGLGGGLILLVSALLQSFPKEAVNAKGKTPRILQHDKKFFKTGVFWSLAISMFIASAGGLIVIGRITSLASDYGLESWGPLALSLLAIGNASGRLVWGGIMDRFGSRAITASFVIMTGGFLLLAFSGGNAVLFLTGVVITGLQFGAALVVFATFTEKYYGAGAIGRVYPFVFIWYGLAALVGPSLGGLFYDHYQDNNLLLFIISALALSGLLVSEIALKAISHSRRKQGQATETP